MTKVHIHQTEKFNRKSHDAYFMFYLYEVDFCYVCLVFPSIFAILTCQMLFDFSVPSRSDKATSRARQDTGYFYSWEFCLSQLRIIYKNAQNIKKRSKTCKNMSARQTKLKITKIRVYHPSDFNKRFKK